MKLIWKFFRQNFKHNCWVSVTLFLFSVISAALEGISFSCLLLSFAALTKEPLPLFFQARFSNPFLFFLCCAITLQILRSVCAYFGQLMTTRLTVTIQHEAQKQVFEKIFKLSFQDVSQLKKGDLMQQATAPPAFIPQLFDEYNRIIISILMVVGYLLFMCRLSFPLTVLILIFFTLLGYLQRASITKISKASQNHADHVADLSKHMSQSIDGIKSVHLFQRQDYVLRSLASSLAKISGATRLLKKAHALIPAINETLGVILVGISLLAGTFFLKKGGILYASHLFTYLTLTYRLATRLQLLMSAKGILAYYSGPLHKLKALLSLKSPSQTPQKSVSLNFERAITFENVSLLYPHQKSYALKNISLEIPKNRITAFVGLSGAGKSSLLDLLVGLYPPSEGSIRVDDQMSNHGEYWQNMFGVVPQEIYLFDTTVEENIRFGKLDASESQIRQAAILAGADSFIGRLPKGYQTLIGEKGYRLSGGEKQRIALAQALVRNPQVLVLDEATSHLDSSSEQLIQQTLFELRKHKTIILVAHRLSTIQMADTIYVLKNGQIVEKGSHQELLTLEGHYYNFWNLY